MISIAICDDEPQAGSALAKSVQGIFSEKGIACEIKLFSDSMRLMQEVEKHTDFELFLLDIEMPQLDGIRLAEKIKKRQPNCLIIFITSHDRYVYDSFKVQPFRFIPKSWMEERLPEALSEAHVWIEKNIHIFYCIENQKGTEKIPIGEIVYIWHRGKYAYIEKMNGESSKIRKTLKQVFEELPKEDFAWIDKGCICNLSHIMKISGADVIFENGKRLAVSRDRLTEVKEKLRRYWLYIGER